MRWEFSAEQQLFRDALADWLSEQATGATRRRWPESDEVTGFEQQLVAGSWIGVGTAEELGGQGGGMVELAIAAEELGRAVAPSASWLTSMVALPALAGSAPAIADLVNGGFVALAVPATAPPDVAAALLVEDGRVSGTVSDVLGADRVSHFVAPIATRHGMWLGLIDRQHVSVAARRLLDRSRTVADVTFNDAPAVMLPTDAPAALRHASSRAAILVAADALGAMDRMLSMTVTYAKQRQQFGVPIASFQAVKHAAASMLVGVEAARSIVYYAAASLSEHHPDSDRHAAVAKAQVTAHAKHAADSALTLHGAIGYTWEYDLHLLYKRALLDGPLFGAAEVWNERVAASLPLVPGEEDHRAVWSAI
jgi:alkylation response protein AidB-like acyl-CoA dehydrogenase